MADSAVDALRRRHADHRNQTDARRRQVYGAAKARAISDGERVYDDDAADENMPAAQALMDGGGFSLFGISDFILLAALLTIVWLYVKTTQNIDLAALAWTYVSPNYDKGFFDEDAGNAGEL